MQKLITTKQENNLRIFYSQPKGDEHFKQVYSALWDEVIHPFTLKLRIKGGL